MQRSIEIVFIEEYISIFHCCIFPFPAWFFEVNFKLLEVLLAEAMAD